MSVIYKTYELTIRTSWSLSRRILKRGQEKRERREREREKRGEMNGFLEETRALDFVRSKVRS